jgi:hypothetical protein
VFGRNTRIRSLYIKNAISSRFVEIPEVKEIIWMEFRINGTSYDGLIIDIIKNPPRKSRWYYANLI